MPDCLETGEKLFVHNMNAQCVQKPEEGNGPLGTGGVQCCKIVQGKCFRIISTVSPVKLYCCYGVIMVLTVAVIALSVALSTKKTEQIIINKTYAACSKNWTGVGNKCFYFSGYPRNWTFAQAFCMAQEAQLARFDNEEELIFLKRFKGDFDCWIGLHRESSEHPWKWTNNTEYNNMNPILGVGRYAYLSSDRISSSRSYINRMWICSKLNNYNLHCQTPPV
ncbi:C-type lectin domain family 2 member I isoform 3 [Mus musculus]|uniref:C-type lectin domain family 2 member I n=2 Tax=Mus musculus TaxID=10090 RepID=B7ZP15_MOUSE|nr:C-type lectin domain family 2 member I isoform 3 [Mus musculus]AAI45575.1 Clec2i protein [Mus musculus]AAN15951.1 osteoclast inhibitory lectin related protein 2 [Mus musculus]AAN15953.1 osteoclast inhibitory lectin related protein 2 [Mus musculus]AAP32745.1 lymphoid-derived C-type lectin-1b [Mus musculus]AFI61948.1 ClrG [Mus musculus]|eukprot:NP_001276636.1 C-type lectin domain family 2 member I isoform 3 [Mus musculus]